jgi:hypothetical protein
VVVDPARIQRNDLPPPVLVESLAADGKPLPLAESVEVAAGTRQLVIHYTGLSLTRPELVRFRYMLEGFDHDWIDAGDRRVAYYTRLPPGRYRFRVIAANNDGVWNETGAGFALRQLPEFYETGWFAALCAVAVLGAGIGVHRVRLRAHLRREAQLAARVQEGLARIKTLSGMLPICAWCKKVREDTGYWRQIETYVAEHSHAEFTHGICPDCGEAMKARTGDTAAPRSDA